MTKANNLYTPLTILNVYSSFNVAPPSSLSHMQAGIGILQTPFSCDFLRDEPIANNR